MYNVLDYLHAVYVYSNSQVYARYTYGKCEGTTFNVVYVT